MIKSKKKNSNKTRKIKRTKKRTRVPKQNSRRSRLSRQRKRACKRIILLPSEPHSFLERRSRSIKRKKTRKKKQRGGGKELTEITQRLIELEVEKTKKQAEEECCKRVANAIEKENKECCEKLKVLIMCMENNTDKDRKKICKEFIKNIKKKGSISMEEIENIRISINEDDDLVSI